MGSFNICTLHNFVSIHVHNENFFHKNLGWGTKGNHVCVAMVSHDRLVGEFKIKKKPIEKKKSFMKVFQFSFFLSASKSGQCSCGRLDCKEWQSSCTQKKNDGEEKKQNGKQNLGTGQMSPLIRTRPNRAWQPSVLILSKPFLIFSFLVVPPSS